MPLKKIEQNVDKTYYTWVLENISETFSKVDPDVVNHSVYPVQKTHLFSTEFKGHTIDWYVKLLFCNNRLHGGFKIEFDAVKQLELKNHLTCNFYLVDVDKNKFFIGRKNRKFHSTFFYSPETSSSTLCNLSRLPTTEDKLLPNDTMTLLIELITYLDDNPIFPLEHIKYGIEPVVNLDDILKLYKVQDDRDIMIYVQSIEFSVHKTVLKKRCPKTYKIIARYQKMSDSNNNQLVLTDIKPDIFKKVLEFIYTGKVEDLDDHAEDLLKFASKFELIGLKYLCELSIVNNYLTHENSEEVKNLARRCSAFYLLLNVETLQDETDVSLLDFSCTLSGTLIIRRFRSDKEVYENHFKNGIPEGIRIVPEEMALYD